jgi:hypothetical protein
MINNVGLDIFIGLVFIFLLYSLLASILGEMFATAIALRARNLREAVDRMLNDEEKRERGFFERLWDSMRFTRKPKNPRITNFYNHPEIKYLGSSGIFKVPSQFQAVSFSKTLLNLLNETSIKKTISGDTQMENEHEGDIPDIPVEEITRDRIRHALEEIVKEHKANRKIIEAYKAKIRKAEEEAKKELIEVTQAKANKEQIVLDEETAKYVLTMWHASHGDLVKFKVHLETWFDRTMEQCLEWYKRKIQMILLVIGFLMAWIFNADTFKIIHRLSIDRDARDKLVTMASSYSKNGTVNIDTTRIPADQQAELNTVLTSLKTSEEQLNKDIAETNNLLGLMSWLPDTIEFKLNPRTKRLEPPSYLEPAALTDDIYQQYSTLMQRNKPAKLAIDPYYKWGYFFGLLGLHFWGYILMALAVSLGAPFWFDLLNKIMRLRTAVKQPLDTTKGDDKIVSPINRVG